MGKKNSFFQADDDEQHGSRWRKAATAKDYEAVTLERLRQRRGRAIGPNQSASYSALKSVSIAPQTSPRIEAPRIMKQRQRTVLGLVLHGAKINSVNLEH